jgi:hypothetical protein
MPRQRATTAGGGRGHHPASRTKLPNVPPPLTAASLAATGYGGMCDVSLGQRAATVVLTFALKGDPFWHFTGADGLICQKFGL